MEIVELIRPMVQHTLEVGNLFNHNMALKNGLPQPENVLLDKSPSGASRVLPIAQALPATGSKLLPLALAAATMVASGGVGAGLATWLLNRSPPAAAAPTAAARVTIESEAGLLSDLQERGFHLDPKENR